MCIKPQVKGKLEIASALRTSNNNKEAQATQASQLKIIRRLEQLEPPN
jgi:hypothetical protein